MLSSPRVNDEIHGFGCVAGKDHRSLSGGIEETGNLLPRLLIQLGCFNRERMCASMNVGMMVVVVIDHGLDDLPRFL